ncbi:MAG: methylmalonyl Co-A mutase-associated GTPase MeaB [Bacteroidota bacterium]
MPDKIKQHKSNLHVQPGIPPPSRVNEEAIRKLKSITSTTFTTTQFLGGILSGNRTILSKAITLIESSLPEHQSQAQEIIAACLQEQRTRDEGRGTKDKEISRIPDPVSRIAHQSKIAHLKSSIRVGITGVPGVGKSTFIEALGKHITGLGHKLAVLAVDPSSTLSKGSILGDKTRMESLAVDPNAFIRPSPSSGTLGGVARKTRETIYLCEAAGFDVIFVETVGVGQSETTVKSMVDFFLLLMLAGAGDELQGIKRGIIEMADAIIVNKADGDNLAKTNIAAAQYTTALHLFPPSHTGWMPLVDTCSAKTGKGIPEIWKIMLAYQSAMTQQGHFQRNRISQNRQVFHQAIEEKLKENFYSNSAIQEKIRQLDEEVSNGTLNPYQAAGELLSSK